MTHYQLVSSNKRKSFLVIFFFMIFVVIASTTMIYAFDFSPSLIGWALIASGVMSFISYWNSDKIILAISGAKPANREQHFDFYTVAENLAMSQRLPKPKLYVINDTAMNAFATGRDPEHAVVCITTGLLTKLERPELEGVVAHELSHVKNYDIRLMSIVSILVGFIVLLADWMVIISFFRGDSKNNRSDNQLQGIIALVGFALVILSPIIAQLIKLWISRNREYLADASAVAMTKNPQGLINALNKLSLDKEPLEAANKATAHLYIEDPLKNNLKGKVAFAKMFQTHPPVKERIAALQKITNPAFSQ